MTAPASAATVPPLPLPAAIAPLLDQLWVLVAAALVFFMQAGFKCVEVGMAQRKSSTSVAMKNLVNWVLTSLFFFLFGFALLFGHSWHGLVGTSLFALKDAATPQALGLVFFLFQAAFASTSTTIVSGALAERTSFAAFLIGCVWQAAVVYPVFGHWVWSGAFDSTNPGWLQKLGFIDFAGSSAVHSNGAWYALVGAWMVGPRRGRFDAHGNACSLRPNSMAYATLGVFILWFGWWGFNGGSTLHLNAAVAGIILNTNLAGAMGGLVAFAHAQAVPGRRDVGEKFLGGALGGLVAITANCHLVSPMAALAIGAVAGVLHNIGFDLLLHRLKIDDPVGAIPVHGVCGVWGTLAVALFGRAELLPLPRWQQLGVQALGALACFAWAAANATVIYYLLKRTVGLRVSATEEELGVGLTPDLMSPSLPPTTKS
ncbi:MAG: ammonium transporter [Deltaproteobacteria bacterium]|nr:ammonium transporter [Deltaproteobacteria bacterium]